MFTYSAHSCILLLIRLIDSWQLAFVWYNFIDNRSTRAADLKLLARLFPELDSTQSNYHDKSLSYNFTRDNSFVEELCVKTCSGTWHLL